MSFDVFSAIVLTFCLICFFTLNILNLIIHLKPRSKTKSKQHSSRGDEHRVPTDPIILIAGFGTLVYWVEALLYPVLVFTSSFSKLKSFSLSFTSPFGLILRWTGLGLLAIGFFLFSWSVIVRGRYAISWKMPEDHVLVTWGPYGFVRHPSYLSYFIMFIGLFLLWMNLFAAIPLIAIPGYVRITDKEEEMLVERFGELYLQYQKRVNKFFPRLKRREN